MNQKRLRQMYGSTPPDFEQRVRAALSAEVPRTRRCVVPRRAALIAALALLLAGAAAVAAFHSQVAAYFGWFYGDEARQRLETGGAYVPEETLYTPDAAYTMEEIVRTEEGLYGVGRAVPAEGVVLMPGDAQAEDASALAPDAPSYLERARTAGARLVAVKVTPRALGAPGAEETPVETAGYLLFPLEDGSLRFAFEIPAEGTAEGPVVLTLWVSRWEIAPDGVPLRGGEEDTYAREAWHVTVSGDE